MRGLREATARESEMKSEAGRGREKKTERGRDGERGRERGRGRERDGGRESSVNRAPSYTVVFEGRSPIILIVT